MVVFVKKATSSAITAIALFILSHQAHAQSDKLYSLAELVDSAKHFFPSLLQKEALANSAKAGIAEARHTYLPQLAISEQVLAASANALPGSYLPIGIIPSVSGSIDSRNNNTPASGNVAALYAQYELYNFGLKNAKNKNAEAFAGLQEADFEKELYVVKWQIGKLYFDLLKNKYQLAVDSQNIRRYESIYNVIQALTSSGINAGVDSSLAKAELSKTRIAYNNRLGQLTQLQQQMSYYTGISEEINIDTSENKYGTTNKTAFSAITDTLQNPLTDYYIRQEALFKTTEMLVKKMYLPKVLLAASGWGRGSSIDYSGQYREFSDGLGYERFNYAIGIGVTYDLLNGIRKKDRLTVTRFQTDAAAYETMKQKLVLKTAARQADALVKVAEKNLAELPLQLRAASDAFDQKVAQYKAGIINLVDLTNASFVLYTAQSDYGQTLNDWFIANLNKAAATGNLDFFIQSIKR